MADGTAPTIATGPEMQEVETEHLGFKALAQGKAGPKKVKLLPPWPVDQLPSPSATLLSITAKHGLLAAAGPGTLVITSTESVRNAYQHQTLSETIKDDADPRLDRRDLDVVMDMAVDTTLSVPSLRHVVFSADGEFLVASAEEGGGLAVFDTQRVKAGDKTPMLQIDTDKASLRALQPNPTPDLAHYFAAVSETGKLMLTDVHQNITKTILTDGVICVAWSTRGKAVVAGLQDGSAAIYMTDGKCKGVVPRPPGVDESFAVTGLAWLNNDEFFIIHSAKLQNMDDAQDSKYHHVKSNKGWTSFAFREFPWDPLAPSRDGIPRVLPPRFSALRLRSWQPHLDDMLVVTNSHTDAIAVFASTSQKISPDQTECGELMLVGLEDSKKAAVPRTVYGEDTDSVFVGEALDLSSTEKISRPIPALEEIEKSPWPLPAYMALTHEGVLASWWIVWNRSIEAGTCYPGLALNDADVISATTTPVQSIPTTPARAGPLFGQSSTSASKLPQAFSRPLSTFGTPPDPQSGRAVFGSATPSTLMKPTPPGFGTPAFGSTAPAFGAPSSIGKPLQPAFGTPSAIGKSLQPAFGTPSAIGKSVQPTFGAPSAAGTPGALNFGATAGAGSKPSPWGTSQVSVNQENPFAVAASESSAFAKLGQMDAKADSTASIFGGNSAGKSAFGSFGQSQLPSPFAGLKTESSFGSTAAFGSGAGSTLPSWPGNPAQNGSIFGRNTNSPFNAAPSESKVSDMSDANNVERHQRDKTTLMPQDPSTHQQDKPTFGLSGGFKLGTTFTADSTAKPDLAKPAEPVNNVFFESSFSNMLGTTEVKPPATPVRETPDNDSTTPASPPKPQSLSSTSTPVKNHANPKTTLPAKEEPIPADDAPFPPDFTKTTSPELDDAPLPPDFVKAPPPDSNTEDIPPLAGSPGVKVEAPDSSPDAFPIDDDDEDFPGDEEELRNDTGDIEDKEQDEQDEGDEEKEDEQEGGDEEKEGEQEEGDEEKEGEQEEDDEEVDKSDTGDEAKKVEPEESTEDKETEGQSYLRTASKPAQQSSESFPFARLNQTQQASMAAKPSFPPPKNRTQELRSSKPARSASTPALRTKRDPLTAPGTSLSASIQESQPQVSDLEDEEDERMRERLARPIEPTRTLDEFIAYQNYRGGSPSKTGHAAHIELIYKDINGMVDALGWNVRSIKSFTEYHKKSQSDHNVDRHTLEDVQDGGDDDSWFDDFTMCEIEALKALEDVLEEELDTGRVQNVLDKLVQLARLLRDKARLMTRLNDIRRQIINRKDPEKANALRKVPLSKEVTDTQKALRNDYARLLVSLQKTEEATSILRTKVVSLNAQSGKTSVVPTVEAVKNTVLKLTSMAEKRNNDILLLESQLRRIGLTDASRPSSSASRTPATPRRTRKGTSTGTIHSSMISDSPYATPITRSSLSLRELNRRALTPDVDATPTSSKGYGLFYTPEGSPSSGNQIARLADVVDDNIDSLRVVARRRRDVAQGLKRALVERGVKLTVVG